MLWKHTGPKLLLFLDNATVVKCPLSEAAVHESLFYPGVETCHMCYSSRFQVMWLLSNYDMVQLVCATLSDDKWLDRPWHTPHVLSSCWLDMEAALGQKRVFEKVVFIWKSRFLDYLDMTFWKQPSLSW